VTALDFGISTAEIGRESYVVSLAGELDLFRAAELESGLERLAERDALLVVVDCNGVSFVDSSVLAVLTRELERMRTIGGELVIVSDDPRIRRAFEISGLDQLFRIERFLSGAVPAAAKSAAEPSWAARDLRADLADLKERNRQLEHALESRIVIEQAKGVLAERLGLGVDDAFDVLRRAARSNRVKLRDLAAEVVAARLTPAAIQSALGGRSANGGAA